VCLAAVKRRSPNTIECLNCNLKTCIQTGDIHLRWDPPPSLSAIQPDDIIEYSIGGVAEEGSRDHEHKNYLVVHGKSLEYYGSPKYGITRGVSPRIFTAKKSYMSTISKNSH